MRIQYNVFFISGLIALASCGEKQTTTIGEGNTDSDTASMDSADLGTTDSIGKRLGVAMPSTAQKFTQIPERDPNKSEIGRISGSRGGTVLAARTTDSILLLDGSDLAIKTEIPSDSLIKWFGDNYFEAGQNFVFDLSGVEADNSGNLGWVMETYRITPNHPKYGKLVSRAVLNFKRGDAIKDVQVLKDEIVCLTNNLDGGAAWIYTFDAAGVLLRSWKVDDQMPGTFPARLATVSGVVNGQTVSEYWLYGNDFVGGTSSVYRFSPTGTRLGKYSTSENVYIKRLASSTSGELKIFAYAGSPDENLIVSKLKTYAVPYSKVIDAQTNFPIGSSTIMANVDEFDADYHYDRADRLVVLGDKILGTEDVYLADAWSSPRQTGQSSQRLLS